MAVELIQREITAAVKEYTDRKLRNTIGKTMIHEVTLTDDASVSAMVDGVNKIMKNAGYDQQYITTINNTYNTEANWRNVLNIVFRRLNSLPMVQTNHELKTINQLSSSKLDNVYLLNGSTPQRMIIRLYAGQEYGGKMSTNLNTFLFALRRELFDEWKKILPSTDGNLGAVSVEKGAGRGTKVGNIYASAAFGSGTPFAHDASSTIGKYGLEQILYELQGNEELAMSLEFKGLQGFTTDLQNSLVKSTGITYEETEVTMPDGSISITRVIKGEIRSQGKEPSDWTNIKKQILGSKSQNIKGALAETLEDKVNAMNPQQALEAEGSPSAKKRMADRAAKAIVENLAKKNKRARVLKKKAVKKTPKKVVKVSGSSITTKKRTVNLGAVQRVVVSGKILKNEQKRERGSGVDVNSLARLKATLNRRLPAEVRRNMGRPALINRTGRFSDSVQITSLRQAQKTIVGEYTYQLDPYSTFENNGSRQWPTGYNPKPLITKSIRNLAAGYVENKFTLRRV